ncbi:MAG: hypothetical protein M1819_006952 [Sarea resinae]|nr:MAG: hypothetical protein M1819_006952 [Sarea resinae]
MSSSSSEDEAGDQWGFVVYRTTYDDDAAFAVAKTKILATLSTAEGREEIEENRGDPDLATLKFIDDEAALKDRTAQEVRLIFNPLYKPNNPDDDDDEADRGPPLRSDGLCSDACLMIDAASLHSILHATDDEPGYVIAIDAATEVSEQYTDQMDQDGETHLEPVPWDGTMRVRVESIFSEFYLRSVGEGILTMGEIHGDMGTVWEFA